MGYLKMSTWDDRRLSDSCISTVNVYVEGRNDELPLGSKGVRSAIVAINATNCVTGKLRITDWYKNHMQWPYDEIDNIVSWQIFF